MRISRRTAMTALASLALTACGGGDGTGESRARPEDGGGTFEGPSVDGGAVSAVDAAGSGRDGAADGRDPGGAGAGDASAASKGPCEASLRTMTLPGIPRFLAVDGADTLYVANWGIHDSLYAVDLTTGAGRLVYQDIASNTWGAKFSEMVVSAGHVYLAGSGGIIRIEAATGAKETVASDMVSGFDVHGTTAYYSNVNGEIRALSLQPLGTGSAVFAKNGLNYQSAALRAGSSGLVVIGNLNLATYAVFLVPYDKSPPKLLAGANEYYYGAGSAAGHAYFLTRHSSGTPHESTGRVRLDGSSGTAIEWLSSTNSLNPQNGASPRVPLTSDSVILVQRPAAGVGAVLSRRMFQGNVQCDLLTSAKALEGVSSAAAGPHSFAWADFAGALRWYRFP